MKGILWTLGLCLSLIAPLTPATATAAGFGMRCDDRGVGRSRAPYRRPVPPALSAPRPSPEAALPPLAERPRRSSPQPDWVTELYRTWGDPAARRR